MALFGMVSCHWIFICQITFIPGLFFTFTPKSNTCLMRKQNLKILLTTILLLASCYGFAQFTDDFTDGDFSQNPTWTGDTHLFIIENLKLRLNSSSGNDSTVLVTPSAVMNNTEWNFWIRLAFSPTNNNHPKIYLVSTGADLRGALNGYYIQIGKDGTANKRIYFFRQDGLVRTEILAGTDNLASNTNNHLRIKILRDVNGNWEMYADALGGESYTLQGSVTDATHTSTAWFGVLCKYTSTNARNLYLDDFYVGDIRVDTIPPEIEQVNALSSTELEVIFSEKPEQTSVTNIANYIVSKGIGNPWTVLPDAMNPARMLLYFSSALTNGEYYTLSVQAILDLAGNIMLPAEKDFAYFKANRYDIVINEIMADPTPEVALPAHEFIELFNTTHFPVNLAGWKLLYGNAFRDLPGVAIEPNGFLILGTDAAVQALAQYGAAASILGLSSTALTNSGAILALYNNDGTVMHSVTYSDTWYQNTAKKEGGWTLEAIDPFNPCGEASNWTASKDLRGGTPGTVNSVRADNPDQVAPWLVKAVISGDSALVVTFSEKMQAGGIVSLSSYSVNHGIGNPLSATTNEPVYDIVTLHFGTIFNDQIIYDLTITGTLRDCAGNEVVPGSVIRFAIPINPEPNDIVINEILFNPPAGGTEYVEIYNRSQKVIDLKNVRLSSQDTILNQLTSMQDIAPSGFLIFPEDYFVLTTDPDLVKVYYMTPNPRGFIRMNSVPQFSNTSGIAVLCDPNGSILDRLVYEESMHFPLLNTFKGVALERIDYSRPSDDRTNWHSAASTVGYGTPAYRNSQFMAIIGETEPFTLSPDIFSPDGDGHNDVLSITYSFPETGYVANISIYDVSGRLIRDLVQNQLLGTNGSYTWNGITNNNEKASIGYYLVYIEVFDLNGKIRQYKKTTVLGGRL